MSSDARCVAITGATGGIGSAVVARLAAGGSSVVLLDLDPQTVARSVESLTAAGGRAIGFAVDTTDEPAMGRALADAADHFGGLDGLVTCAAIDHPQLQGIDVDLALWEQVQRVNVTGTFVAARCAARLMRDRGGSIVTIGSVSAATARMGKVPYCTSKAAVVGMTRTLALELASQGIRVNVVCPGPTDTEMVREAIRVGGPEILEKRVRGSLAELRPGIPLGRLGTPEEQAAVIEFVLLSATFMTGAAIFCDGGLTVL